MLLRKTLLFTRTVFDRGFHRHFSLEGEEETGNIRALADKKKRVLFSVLSAGLPKLRAHCNVSCGGRSDLLNQKGFGDAVVDR